MQHRACSSTKFPENKDLKLDPEFRNRNPRALEFMGIARKPKGWAFQYPSKEFYHRLVFEKSKKFIAARVEHNSGKTVISASTKEFAIAKHLYSPSDVSAAEAVGQVIARRCQESGITRMTMLTPLDMDRSEKFQVFQKALEDGGIELSEPEEVLPDYQPGIDYSNEDEVIELMTRQQKVRDLSEEHMNILKFRSKRAGSRLKIPPGVRNLLD